MMATRSALTLLPWVGLCLLAAWIGSLLTRPAIPGWYETLSKPSWTPPHWVFGPVWMTLYIMMGVAAWLVWRRGGWTAAAVPLTLFLIQLVFNVVWSALFFGLRRPDLAFFDIALLWLAIIATLVAFWRVTPAAGWLLSPYWLWVSYAAALNLAIWRMNA